MMAATQRPAGDGRAQDEILAMRLQPSAPQEASTDDRPATDEMRRLQPSLPLLAAAESEPGPSVLGQSSHGREPTAEELWSSLSAAVAAQAEPFELRARAAGREAFGEAFASSPPAEVDRSELGEGTPDREDRARRTAWSPLSPAEAEMAPPATREGTPSQECSVRGLVKPASVPSELKRKWPVMRVFLKRLLCLSVNGNGKFLQS